MCVWGGGGGGREVGWVNAVEFKQIKFCSRSYKTDKTTIEGIHLMSIVTVS